MTGETPAAPPVAGEEEAAPELEVQESV
jgi:hypothetical protein